MAQLLIMFLCQSLQVWGHKFSVYSGTPLRGHPLYNEHLLNPK